MSTFVSVGNANQHFTRLLDAIARVANRLPQPVVIQHGHTPLGPGDYERIDFMSMDEFAFQIESAKLLILHAGAGSVLNALWAGKKPVVVPRRSEYDEHINNHQVEFASMLAREKKVFFLDDIANLDKTIKEAVSFSKSGTDSTRENHVVSREPRLVALIRDVLFHRSQSV